MSYRPFGVNACAFCDHNSYRVRTEGKNPVRSFRQCLDPQVDYLMSRGLGLSVEELMTTPDREQFEVFQQWLAMEG